MKNNTILDLDALEDSVGMIRIKGNDYEMIQPPYKEFTLLGHYFNEIDPPREPNGDLKEGFRLLGLEEKEDRVERIINILRIVIPKCPIKDLKGLTSFKLFKINIVLNEAFADQIGTEMQVDDTGN